MLSKGTIRQFIKFSSVGILNTGVHIIIAFSLIEISGLSPTTGNALAFLSANLFSFFINSTWTFGHRISATLYLRFLLVSLVGLFISWSAVWAAQQAGFHYALGIVSSVILVALAGYVMNRYFVFTEKPSQPS
ncbi:GtrA family protein [Pseudomonas sp. LABIM340]|uniref:GtrA family protein n=1 Tax=Pseudomonas sp. LABIM340 TaxID=3156585 RepID=UPI0032AF93F9